MLSRRNIAAGLLLFLVATALYAQRRYRPQIDDEEDNPAPIPADAAEKTEYVFGRLRYGSGGGGGYYRRRWSSWATDYPKADRQLLQGIRRLSRLHTRSVEQVVDIDSDEIYQYPWIYAVEVGYWDFTEQQAARLRDYLNRGGFLMVDDFHGPLEWESFMEGLRKVLPDKPVMELQNEDQIFHVLYDLNDRPQIPGIYTVFSGQTYEKGGIDPKWRGVYDDKGRLMVAICHNMDLGDAWEWADHPNYPERFASAAYRITLNYIIYAMTH